MHLGFHLAQAATGRWSMAGQVIPYEAETGLLGGLYAGGMDIWYLSYTLFSLSFAEFVNFPN